MKRSAFVSIAILVILILTLSAASTRERYIALAVPVSPVGDANSTIETTVGIERTTPDSQLQELGAVAKKGSDALYKSLSDEKRVGWISIVGRTSVDGKLLISRDTPTGREVTMITSQPIYFFERRNPNRPRDYRFGIVHLSLDKQGNGTGTVTAAAKIKSITPTAIEVDDYGVLPAKLTGVHLSK